MFDYLEPYEPTVETRQPRPLTMAEALARGRRARADAAIGLFSAVRRAVRQIFGAHRAA
ncbi:MAG: hypothetical protein AAGE18_18630 [Pseudomonadota bacterium]